MFPLEKIWFEKQTCLKIELEPLLLKKLICALMPKLLSHSPKENGTNEAEEANIGFIYINGG